MNKEKLIEYVKYIRNDALNAYERNVDVKISELSSVYHIAYAELDLLLKRLEGGWFDE